MNLDRIVKLLPLGAAILIGLGVLKTSVYYNYFGVDIMSYLSTSDVITLFLNDLQPIVVLACTSLVHFNVSERIYEAIESSIGEDQFEKIIREKKWGYVLFFLFTVVISSIVIYYQYLELKNWFIYLFIFSLIQLVFFLFIRRKGKIMIKNKSYMHVFMVICLIAIIPLMALKEIRIVEKNKGRFVTLSLTDNSKVLSSKNNRFLGKAGENYYFFNIRKKMTTIVKAEDVKQIKIKI